MLTNLTQLTRPCMALVGAFSVLYNFADRSSAALFASCISPLTITHRCCCQCCVVAAVSLCYAILLGLSLDGYSYSYRYDCYKAGLLAAYWAGALRWVIAAAALHNTKTGVTALVSASSLFTVAMWQSARGAEQQLTTPHQHSAAPVSCLSGPTLLRRPPLLIMIRLLPTQFHIEHLTLATS